MCKKKFDITDVAVKQHVVYNLDTSPTLKSVKAEAFSLQKCPIEPNIAEL